MAMSSLVTLVPTCVFLIVALGIALAARRRSNSQGGSFASRYYIGNRTLGGFVLAMTTVATYGSVSSFVGGPGQAWSIGWGWVYMAAVQVTALFLLYGILGKKMMLVSHKTGAVTVIDVIRRRYNSNALAALSALIIVLFFAATMVAQFVGGAKLFASVTGYSYELGLAIFGIVVIVFTAIGGFRGVALTDALCGIVMLLGLVILACGLVNAGGGLEQLLQRAEANNPAIADPLSGGSMPYGLYFTQWLLVGIFTFCLPQSVVRCVGARDTKALRDAMVIGTVVIGFMMILGTSMGVLAAGVLTEPLEAYGSVDGIIPTAIASCLPPVLAGVAIVGPIAASISTVSSLLITASSSIVKDLWMHAAASKGRELPEPRVVTASQAITLGVGVIVFVLSLVPPSVIWKINMFAFGGLETAFCWVLVMGLFWKRATKAGALASMAGGTLAYCACMALGFKLFGLHQIVIGISVSLLLMVVVSLLTKCEDEQSLELFFPRKA
ncbi:MAG: sodium/pantothenate symporter [Coriobacteriaceae bacterium]|nr:sodium/pantothenate symporter [Coriobacteriaceae bacterium]